MHWIIVEYTEIGQHFLEIKFIFTDGQFGFRTNRSKTDAISHIMEHLYTNSNTHKFPGVFQRH